MTRWLPAIVFGLGACGFQTAATPEPGPAPDARAPGSDAATPPPSEPPPPPTGGSDDVVNVRAADETIGSVDWVLDRAITIDTGAMTISGGIPAGVTFAPAPQDSGGAELAILHVRRFESGLPITVLGPRPLVILAADIELSSAVDVGTTSAAPCHVAAVDAVAELGDGGAIELYARGRIASSGQIQILGGGQACARGGDGGTIVLQAPIVGNTGRLIANGDGRARGDDDGGRIVLLYRTSVATGTTSPAATTTTY